MDKGKQASAMKEPVIQWEYHYCIVIEELVTFDGRAYIYQPCHTAFAPRPDVGEGAFKECLDVWNSAIVTSTVTERGLRFRYRYRYSIDMDWVSGNHEMTEYRFSDELIRFDRRFKKPTRLPR
jgi:hypothetical protein